MKCKRNIDKWTEGSKPDEADYYYINKKISRTPYYWNGEKWCKLVKAHEGVYSVGAPLKQQPKVKFYGLALN